MKRILTALMLSLLLATVVGAQSESTVLPVIREIGIDSLMDPAKVYFSAGSRDHAEHIAEQHALFVRFISDSLALERNITTILLTRHDWAQVRARLPWFLPPGVAFPTIWDEVILETPPRESDIYVDWMDAFSSVPLDTLASRTAALGMSVEDALVWFADVVAVHEYGHIMIDELLGLQPYHYWLMEFSADYVEYLYVKHVLPDRLGVLDAIIETMLGTDLGPASPNVYDFDERVARGIGVQGGMSSEEYGWYQSWLLTMVNEVEPEQGLGLLQRLSELVPWPAGGEPSIDEMLDEMDKILPGLRSWATPVEGLSFDLPSSFSLGQNYPNPFNPTTMVPYVLHEPSEVRLSVFDVLGRQVSVVAEGMQPPGSHVATFDAGDLPSGIYGYRLEVERDVRTRWMILAQ